MIVLVVRIAEVRDRCAAMEAMGLAQFVCLSVFGLRKGTHAFRTSQDKVATLIDRYPNRSKLGFHKGRAEGRLFK